MDEESTQAVEETQSAAVETTTAESQPVEQTDAEAEQKPAEAGAENTDSGAKPESKPQTHQSRRSSRFMQQRVQQLARENAQLKQQKASSNSDDAMDEWGNATEAEATQPDINKLVAEAVQNALKPVMSEHTKSADEAEMNELFSGDRASDRSRYEGRIREMWETAQYRDVAAADLYKIASFDDAVKAATERAIAEFKKADKEAREASTSGSSNTSNRTGAGPGKSVMDMSDEEFRAHNERIKAGLPSA